ncbi:hypothetical protein [Klebsiella quasipneumoniae]|uniref:hypothetical protein n=1 Tax=Klebsiella quasipneumoniae TaxID=1463165 RepID=UPI0021C4B6D4|nr:hypothetical protein [Klebsiella quasipneumoniae]
MKNREARRLAIETSVSPFVRVRSVVQVTALSRSKFEEVANDGAIAQLGERLPQEVAVKAPPSYLKTHLRVNLKRLRFCSLKIWIKLKIETTHS